MIKNIGSFVNITNDITYDLKYDVCVFVWAYICSMCSTCALVRCRLISNDGGVLSWFGNYQRER
jgi:hypothetical protein